MTKRVIECIDIGYFAYDVDNKENIVGDSDFFFYDDKVNTEPTTPQLQRYNLQCSESLSESKTDHVQQTKKVVNPFTREYFTPADCVVPELIACASVPAHKRRMVLPKLREREEDWCDEIIIFRQLNTRYWREVENVNTWNV